MKKVYQTAWFMLLMLFIFPPVGIFLLWKYFQNWKKGIKIILSVVFGFCFLIVFVGVVEGVFEFVDTQTKSTNAITQTTELTQQKQATNSEKKLPEGNETTSSIVQTTTEKTTEPETTQPMTNSTTKPENKTTTKVSSTKSPVTKAPTTNTRPTTTKTPATAQISNHRYQGGTYVLNKNTKVIHRPGCQHVSKISDENYAETNDFNKAIAQGYAPCKTCTP